MLAVFKNAAAGARRAIDCGADCAMGDAQPVSSKAVPTRHKPRQKNDILLMPGTSAVVMPKQGDGLRQQVGNGV